MPGTVTHWRPGLHPGRGLLSFFRSPRATSPLAYAPLPSRAFVPEIPQPSGTFETWATWTMFLTDTATLVPMPASVTWQAWGVAFLASPRMQAYRLPDPRAFTDWKQWAVAAKDTFPGP